MMDSAALYHSVSPAQTPRQARLCLSMGINCLRSMAGRCTSPTTTIRSRRRRSACRGRSSTRASAGSSRSTSPLERDADEAWRNFQGWRVNYEPIVDALTALIVPPPAPWFVARPELGEAEWPARAQPHAGRAGGGSGVRREQDLQDAVGPGVEQLVGLGRLAQVHAVGERLAQAGEAARLHERDEGRPGARDRARRRRAGSGSSRRRSPSGRGGPW